MIDRRTFVGGGFGAAILGSGGKSNDAGVASLSTRRTVHLTTGLLRDPLLGPRAACCTFTMAMRLEDPPFLIRVGFANDTALDYELRSVAACISADYGDGVNPSGEAQWVVFGTNFGGADVNEQQTRSGSSRELIVRGNGGGPRVANVSWTDWAQVASVAPIDGSGRPILFLRACAPAWNSPRCCISASGFSNSVVARGREILANIKLDEDLATEPGSRVQGFSSYPSSPFYCVQYIGATAAATVLWGGDSHFAGDTTPGNIAAFPLQSCLELSTLEFPFTAANYAWGGSPSMVFIPTMAQMIRLCRPQVVVLQGWTANDGASEASALAYATEVRQLASFASGLGALPVISTRFSRDTLAKNAEQLRIAELVRNSQLSLNSRKLVVVDAASVLDDPFRPGAYRSGLSDDGIHPNSRGHGAVASLFTSILRRLL